MLVSKHSFFLPGLVLLAQLLVSVCANETQKIVRRQARVRRDNGCALCVPMCPISSDGPRMRMARAALAPDEQAVKLFDEIMSGLVSKHPARQTSF